MGSKVRKMLGMVLVVSMIVSCLTGFGKEEAKATQPPVPYLYYDTNGSFEVKSCPIYEIITGSTTTFNGSEEGGNWYVAEGTVTVSDSITVTGTVNLILKDNCVFTASKGIKVATGNAFNIYGQGTINGANTTAGELRATGVEWEAGIGGRTSESVGCITINGGIVTATGGTWGAGIGGGNGGSGGSITINEGTITARGGTGGAGIGGGEKGSVGSITINEGTITATGGNNGAGIGGGENGSVGSITINEGTITAIGGANGAGIGGGNGGSGGNISIIGGSVYATGGTWGAGIGGGNGGSGGSITINKGTITASGGTGGAGIGGGYDKAAGSITINEGTVTATGGANGAGIGGGYYGESGGTITINEGTVTATGGKYGAGIGGGNGGSGGSITIKEGTVTAIGGIDGAGIGGGNYGAGGNISINGGSVYATGEINGAGIGGGDYGAGGNILINGGSVYATGGTNGAGIGKGNNVLDADGTYRLGTGMKGFRSLSEDSGYDVLNCSFGDTSKYVIVYKERSGLLTASGSAITAKYVDGINKQSIDLTINAPSEIVYGNDDSAKATLDSADNFNNALGKTGDEEKVSASQIKYYGAKGELYAAPTDKGNYTAKITVDGVTAAVGYEITKEDPFITAPVATNPAYTGDAQNLITAGLSTGGTLKYSLSEYESFSADIPTATVAGTYTVFYMVEGDNDYKSSITYSVSAGISKASLNLSLTQDGWEKGSTAPDPVLSGNKGDGEVTYAYKKQSEDDSAYVNSVPTEPGDYVVKATVAETANYTGGTTTANFRITEPEYTAPTAIQNLVYTGNPQRLVVPGTASSGTIKYSLTENGTYSEEIPTGTDAGDYTVYYKVIGRDGVTTLVGSSVSVSIAKKSLELTLSQEGWEKGNTAPDPVLSGKEGDGEVTYAYKKQSEGDSAYVNSVPTEPGDYVVKATVAETANYAGGTATAEFSITEPAVTAPVYQPVYYPEEPKPVEKKDDGRTTTTEVKNSDGTISEISVTKLADGSITRETVRDKDGKFVEYKYEYTWTKKNGTTVVQTLNEKADGSKKETSGTTTKSGTVITRVKELTADGTLISTEGKSYADGRTSLKEATTGTDGVTKVVTEKTDAAGNGVKAEYTSVIDDAEAKSDTKISLTAVEVIGTTFKLPAEIWVNEQYFVVTEIGKGALKNNKAVTKLTIGENVTGIGSSAFRNMTNLKSITINASSLESIGKNAFKGVGDKKRVTITNKGVTEAEFEKICKMIRKAGIGKKSEYRITR